MNRTLVNSARIWFAAALVALIYVTPVAADWIVTADGQRLETEGPFEVRGQAVVFKIEGGRNVSLPLSAVDVEASRQASRGATSSPTTRRSRASADTAPTRSRASGEARSPRAEKPTRGGAGLVIDDESVSHFAEKPRPEESQTGPDVARTIERVTQARTRDSRYPPASLSAGVLIEDQRQQVTDEGLTIYGKLRNSNRQEVRNVSLVVTLFDEDDMVLVTDDAALSGHTLQPGQRTHFRVFFPNVDSYVRSQLQSWVPPPESQQN